MSQTIALGDSASFIAMDMGAVVDLSQSSKHRLADVNTH